MRTKRFIVGSVIVVGLSGLLFVLTSAFAQSNTSNPASQSQTGSSIMTPNAHEAIVQRVLAIMQQHFNASSQTQQQTATSALSQVSPESSQPAASPQIISASVNYPPISPAFFTATNYYNAPSLNVMVIAGANTSAPTAGVFMIEDGSSNQTVSVPLGDGIPTFTSVSGSTLSFSTSTGKIGTLNYQTRTVSMNN